MKRKLLLLLMSIMLIKTAHAAGETYGYVPLIVILLAVLIAMIVIYVIIQGRKKH